ncbi:D-alanyl-D-alanine carboxypeptidase [Candidatus Curtissbacteria bacterium]|nr:D-alanyl-D-alanine carboxypeptidase [Candidatus Curtissbacteria bacterium]
MRQNFKFEGSIFLNFEKRLVFIALAFVLSFAVFRQINSQDNSILSPVPINKREAFFDAKKKLTGNDYWQPQGAGSSENVENLPQIRAGAVIDEDSGKVLWSSNLNEKIAPASLSKLATVITALDLASENELLVVSKNASEQIPTKLGLREKERLTLSEAIAGAILTSANDATEVIADDLGKRAGSGTTTFMQLVNEKLKKIGAANTRLETATGLDSVNHYSTVYDLAIIANDAKTNYPLIAKIAASEYLRLDANANHKLFDLPNWNALLGTYPGVDGLKIGYTEEAGHATIVTASREGKNLMAIVVGANSIEDREIAAAALLNYGFSGLGIEPYPVENIDLVKRFEDWRRQLSYAY